MKKLATIAVVAFLTLMPAMVRAGQDGGAAQDRGSDTGKMSRKPTSISGKIGSDGKTLTADKDNKIWMVSNPEALKGIDARHVKVRARVDTAQRQIRIVSVSAIAEERAAGTKFGDAAFRR
ncbi:MAG: hypothetical protein WBR10_11110 [Candidatus Acidiferrum sp.]